MGWAHRVVDDQGYTRVREPDLTVLRGDELDMLRKSAGFVAGKWTIAEVLRRMQEPGRGRYVDTAGYGGTLRRMHRAAACRLYRAGVIRVSLRGSYRLTNTLLVPGALECPEMAEQLWAGER